MDKNDEHKIINNNEISLSNRNKLFISGVTKIDNFDNNEFVMNTTMGILIIRGDSLELIKLDTIQGNISIKGNVDSIEYKTCKKTCQGKRDDNCKYLLKSGNVRARADKKPALNPTTKRILIGC